MKTSLPTTDNRAGVAVASLDNNYRNRFFLKKKLIFFDSLLLNCFYLYLPYELTGEL